jgi:hypothetical protein
MMKLGQKKFGKPGSSTSLRQASWKSLAVSCNVQVWGLSLVGVFSVGVLLFCFVFVDMRVFVSKTLQLSFGPSGGDGDHHHPNSYHLQEALMVVSDSDSFVEEELPPPPAAAAGGERRTDEIRSSSTTTFLSLLFRRRFLQTSTGGGDGGGGRQFLCDLMRFSSYSLRHLGVGFSGPNLSPVWMIYSAHVVPKSFANQRRHSSSLT